MRCECDGFSFVFVYYIQIMGEISGTLDKLKIDEPIFKDVQYYITGNVTEKVEELLRTGGATRRKYFSDFVTHVICGENVDDTDIADANDLFEIPAVCQSWVISCARLHKIVGLKPYIFCRNKLFSSVTACIANISEVDLKSIWALLTYYGGIGKVNLDAKCTHLICGSPKGARYTMGLSIPSEKLKIVTPDWLLDSIKSNTVCAADVYHPRLLQTLPEVNTEPKGESKNGMSAITGFDFEESLAKTEVPTQAAAVNKDTESTQALLDKLKQRMPWNTSGNGSPLPVTSLNNNKLASPQQTTHPTISKPSNPPSIQTSTMMPTTQNNQIQNLTSAQIQQHCFMQQQQMRNIQQQNQLCGNQLQKTSVNTQQHASPHIGPVQGQQGANVSWKPQNVPNDQNPIINQQMLNQQKLMMQKQLIGPNPTRQMSVNQSGGQIISQMSNEVPSIICNQQNHMNQQILNQQNQIQSQQTIPQSQNLKDMQNQQIKEMQHHTTQQMMMQSKSQAATSQSLQIGQQQGQILHQTSLQHQHLMSSGSKMQQNIQIQNMHNNPSQPGQQLIMQNQQMVTQSGSQMISQLNIQNNQQLMPQQIQQINPQSLQMNQQLINQQNQQLSNQQTHQLANQQNQHVNQQNQQLINQQNQHLLNHQNQQLSNQQNQQLANQQNQQLANQQNQQLVSQQLTNQQNQQLASQQNQQLTNQQHLNQHNQQHVNQQNQQHGNQQNQQLSNQQTQQLTNLQNQHVNQQNQLSNQQNQQLLNQQNQHVNQQNQLGNQQNIQHVNQQNQQLANQQNQQLLNQQNQQLVNQQNNQLLQQNQLAQQNSQVVQQNPQMLQNQQNSQVWQHQQFIQRQQLPNQRGPWPPGAQPGAPQRQLIHLDAQTHAQLQQMDPQQRALFVAKLQKHRHLIMQRQQQARGMPRPQQISVIRGQVPPGLSPQQQMQWLQQQGARPQTVTVVGGAQNTGGAPGLSPISQQPTAFQLDTNNASQQQMTQLQQYRLQQMQMQREQARKQGGQVQGAPVIHPQCPEAPQAPNEPAPAVPTPGPVETPVQGSSSQALVVNSKTKTALANMLSIRLQSGGNAVAPLGPEQSEPSAAGTLRLMTAQHNASLNSAPPRNPQELLALQQRRALGTITNGAINQVSQGPTPPTTPQTPGPPVKGPFSPVRVQPPPRPQFYGHNPNLKLPPDLFLLGCIFVIVEYDVSVPNEVNDWKTLIAKHGGEVEPCYCARVTHVLCETQKHGVVMQALRDCKRCVTSYWLNDTVIKKQVSPPWQALHLPLFSTQLPAYKHIISYTGFEGDERDRVREMIKKTGAYVTTYLSKHNTILVCRKPEGCKYNHARDWGISVVSALWLSDLLLGNVGALNQTESAKYQQYNAQSSFRMDYVLVPHLMAAWKSPINITQESHERVKRGLGPPTTPTRAKKPRLPKVSPTTDLQTVALTCIQPPTPEEAPRVLFSLLTGKELDDLQIIVKQLGGLIVHEPDEATHLVMGSPQRTPKFLKCMIVCQHIVTPSWLRESSNSNYFLPADKYTIEDKALTESFKCDVGKILATPNRTELLKGKTFYITNSVQPSKKTLKSLIEMLGGSVEKVRKTVKQIQEMNTLNPLSYIVISCTDDVHLVIDILRANKDCLKIVCNSEFVMSACIMQQKIEIDPYRVN